MPPAAAISTPHTMQCMEVWGGNRATNNGVVMPGLNAWVIARPFEGDAEGGDIHYVSSCATGRITRLLVADVSGHGAGVSGVAEGLRNLMRRYSNYLDQTRFVAELNERFSELAEAGAFATAIAATYWAPTDVLATSNAGHPPPLWRRAKSGEWGLLSAESAGAADRGEGLVNLPLGIASPTRYDQFGVRLGKDDLVLVYTDALIEARPEGGAALGTEGLLEIARGLDATRPDALLPALLERVEAFAGGAERINDDVTALLLHRNGLRPPMGLGDRVKASARFVGEVARSARSGFRRPVPWPEARLESLGAMVVPKWGERWGKK